MIHANKMVLPIIDIEELNNYDENKCNFKKNILNHVQILKTDKKGISEKRNRERS